MREIISKFKFKLNDQRLEIDTRKISFEMNAIISEYLVHALCGRGKEHRVFSLLICSLRFLACLLACLLRTHGCTHAYEFLIFDFCLDLFGDTAPLELVNA